MLIDFNEKEIEYLERIMGKSLKASRKNLSQTKCEDQKESIQISIGIKGNIIKKIREAEKDSAINK